MTAERAIQYGFDMSSPRSAARTASPRNMPAPFIQQMSEQRLREVTALARACSASDFHPIRPQEED